MKNCKLSEEFYEKIFEMEINLMNNFDINELSELMRMYQKCIEYYEKENNYEICEGFQKRMEHFMIQPFIQKNIKKNYFSEANDEVNKAKDKCELYEKMKSRLKYEYISHIINYDAKSRSEKEKISYDISHSANKLNNVIQNEFTLQINIFHKKLKSQNKTKNILQVDISKKREINDFLAETFANFNEYFYTKLIAKLIEKLRNIYDEKYAKYKTIIEYYSKDIRESQEIIANDNSSPYNEILSSILNEKENEIKSLCESIDEKINNTNNEFKSNLNIDPIIIAEINKIKIKILSYINQIIY